jgi:hypothetical protein
MKFGSKNGALYKLLWSVPILLGFEVKIMFNPGCSEVQIPAHADGGPRVQTCSLVPPATPPSKIFNSQAHPNIT